MKRIPNWIVFILVLAMLIAVKFIFFGKTDKGMPTGAKGKPSSVVSVNYVVASPSFFSSNVYALGKIGAMNEVELKPEIPGKLVSVLFKDGENVNKGEVIARLNDAELQAQMAKNRVQLKLAEEKLDRLKKLLSIHGVSKEEYDIQDNEVEFLKADAAFIQAQIQKTYIFAPFTGVIGLRNLSEGAFVSPSESIALLVQLQPLYVEFSLPEKFSAYLKKGMIIHFALGNNTVRTYTATLYAVEPKIDESTRTVRARATYEGKDMVYPGAFVKVFIDVNSNEKSIMIPTQCVIPVFKGQKVFVCRNGVAVEVNVTGGIRTDEMIQILDGLNAGDTVITTGLMTVKKDAKLKLIRQDN